MVSLKPASVMPGGHSNSSLPSTNNTFGTKNLLSAPKTATGSTRQLMFRLLDHATSSQTDLNKEIT
jgi:hypothetical protein